MKTLKNKKIFSYIGEYKQIKNVYNESEKIFILFFLFACIHFRKSFAEKDEGFEDLKNILIYILYKNLFVHGVGFLFKQNKF